MPRLVECVPNFSEGRDRAIIDAIANAMSGVSGVKLLDVDPGADTNRTVYTMVGSPEAVQEAAFRAAQVAAGLLDMAQHKGAHPRIGALDVCPFIPVSDVTMEECAAMARAVGRRIGSELGIPVYFYEHAASSDQRRSLANIRAGEYEGLSQKLQDPAWAPDAGPTTFNRRSGATVVGAREFLLAYNVNLNTLDRRLANEIALNIREGGRAKRDGQGAIIRDGDGASVKVPGRLKAVRAIGWYIEQYGQAQVSINLLDYATTPLHQVFETVREEAARLGLRVTGSEMVGLTPLAPMLEAGRFYLRKQGKSAGVPERELVEMAVKSLGLDQVSPFDPDKKIIEYHFRPAAPPAAPECPWAAALRRGPC
jgi:glutamate formiminotransferase/formiminotetrahydrofolate cyclodeaminase